MTVLKLCENGFSGLCLADEILLVCNVSKHKSYDVKWNEVVMLS